MRKQMEYMGGEGSSEVMRRIDKSLIWLYKLLPFTYSGVYRSRLEDLLGLKEKITVLDLGCGDGSGTQSIGFPKNFELTGVDIYAPYLFLAKKKKIYKRLIQKDVTKIGLTPKYDIVIANHVLEHLGKKEGWKFLQKIEKIAKRKIIIACPIGNLPQEEYDDNPYQIHRSKWTVVEMREKGYKIRAQGLKFLWGNENIVKKYGIFSYLLFILSAILSPLLYFFPELGTYMICWKEMVLGR